MSKVKIVMPQMGESITTGTITKWNKNIGDKIEIDDILLEISTDKVESEIPSPVAGIVTSILNKVGDTVDVGLVIAEIEDDVNAVAPELPSPPTLTPTSEPVITENTENSKNAKNKFFTPLVKSMANAHNVPLEKLENIEGSGLAGRVNKQDFLNFVSTNTNTTPVATPATATTTATVASSQNQRVEYIPLDNMRKAIAKNMILSKQTSPHVNSLSEVDVTHLVKSRDLLKDSFLKQEGFKLTFGPIIAYAIIQALREFPKVNASLDESGENLIIKKDVHLGIAVSVPGNGLVVPVIKNACTMNFIGICRSMNELAQKARAKKLTMNELQGGTFTFTNVGSFGTLFATPIILQPQLGIYASGAIKKRPIVLTHRDGTDTISVRSMMYGTHTYDHRMIDGELGGIFLEAIHQNLINMNLEKLL